VRLPRIRRLVDLGVPLSDIPAMAESDENAEQTPRALAEDYAPTVRRQYGLVELDNHALVPGTPPRRPVPAAKRSVS
jgi:hypothetical protein